MSIHVVHIEDDRMLRDILRTSFQIAAPEVQLKQYTNGDDALPYIEQNVKIIDLFIIDIRLPGSVNGLQLAQKIRELGCPGHLVLTSAYTAPSADWLASLSCEYLPKPWHILELMQKLVQCQLVPVLNHNSIKPMRLDYRRQ